MKLGSSHLSTQVHNCKHYMSVQKITIKKRNVNVIKINATSRQSTNLLLGSGASTEKFLHFSSLNAFTVSICRLTASAEDGFGEFLMILILSLIDSKSEKL